MSVACYHIGLQWVALLLALIMSSTVLMTYLISVNRGHVNAELPFISSTGAYPPESCIFGEGLNLAAFLINVELIHDIGAGMAFYGTTCYILLCALVSQRYLGTHWCIWIFRLLLGIAATIATIMFCHTVSRINFNGTQEESLIYRHPGQGGFSFYLCSTSFEWVAGFFIILFFITWAYEFRLYAIQLPQLNNCFKEIM
ncbi:DNA damage-regulated autophagy modulator protein 2 [Schistosoma japonicum]|nr:DNA damage-regulated autophagy modulator protein 2 [Schistosoma japonicum]